MRSILALAPLLICASPALAQAPAEPAAPPRIGIPSELTDPATADRLANTVQALSRAVMDVRIGELQAAIEGREATAADKKLTVRDFARRNDPDFERTFRRQMAQARPMIRQSVKALADAWPSVVQGLSQAQKSLERAAANMPDPTYPKR